MLENVNIENILFLDIETVPIVSDYDKLPENFRTLWDKKAELLGSYDRRMEKEPGTPEGIFRRAGIYAEFGKIICISTGIIRNQSVWIKSFYGDDEKEILMDFSEMLSKAKGKSFQFLCAHNGKEFDYPFLIRRMLINGLPVPGLLDLVGKKPWEVNHFDTMELWKFGDYKNYTSLELLATVFGIPSPKDDIRGEDIARVYWEEKDMERIVTYCQKDVLTIVNLFLRFQGKEILTESSVQIVNTK
jgi:3'-5' exonuclease